MQHLDKTHTNAQKSPAGFEPRTFLVKNNQTLVVHSTGTNQFLLLQKDVRVHKREKSLITSHLIHGLLIFGVCVERVWQG